MDTGARMQEEMRRLEREFPGKRVIALPPEDPTEIIAELGGDSGQSAAVAVILRSKPHVHRQTAETYEVEEGELYLFLDGELRVLGPGERLTVQPGQEHWAQGAPTRVRVTSSPPWSAADHILTE